MASSDKDTPILITGAAGFIGKNLVARLRAEGYTNLLPYDLATEKERLLDYAKKAGFVFHLAGVNRPTDKSEFYTGNANFTLELLSLLREAKNPAPVLLTSSAQVGNGTDYALSKQQAEEAVFEHGAFNQGQVFVFRLPGVFGKWCRPSYNSVVATFCYNTARSLPVEVRDPAFSLPLCYIDDVTERFLQVLRQEVQSLPAGQFFPMAPVYTATLGELADTIQSYARSREFFSVPQVDSDFHKKLYATYLSYLPEDCFDYLLDKKSDNRGFFAEFLRSEQTGQMSINLSRPGIVKGNHWHNTKNEKFLVVSGKALIRFRRLGTEEVIEYAVAGEDLRVVDIPPGYTHNIENLGETDLVTLMWASETFDPGHPDTYYEEV